jgi:hypothetical protein
MDISQTCLDSAHIILLLVLYISNTKHRNTAHLEGFLTNSGAQRGDVEIEASRFGIPLGERNPNSDTSGAGEIWAPIEAHLY